MTREERKTLLRDLCAKAPYNLTFRFTAEAAKRDHHDPDADYLLIGYPLRESPDEMIPYLRPLSSMTEKEQAELRNILGDLAPEGKIELYDGCLWNDSEVSRFPIAELTLLYDWLAYLEKQKEPQELPLMNGDADLYFDNWNQHNDSSKRGCFNEGIRYAQRLQKEQKRYWKPSEEQIGALNYAYGELFKREDVWHNILGQLQKLLDDLKKL